MPPQYDEEILSYPEGGDQECAVDFTRDRTPADREEIATRCGADKIFVPNGFHGKTSVLHLYVSGVINSAQLERLFYNDIGLEDIMSYCWRYLNGDAPVGGIMDVEAKTTFNISDAFDKNLISKKQAIMMLEAQA